MLKTTRYILLVIGILGIASAGYGLVKGEGLVNQLLPLTCGASLIYGYFFIGKSQQTKE